MIPHTSQKLQRLLPSFQDWLLSGFTRTEEGASLWTYRLGNLTFIPLSKIRRLYRKFQIKIMRKMFLFFCAVDQDQYTSSVKDKYSCIHFRKIIWTHIIVSPSWSGFYSNPLFVSGHMYIGYK
jgi:hypothetical protein